MARPKVLIEVTDGVASYQTRGAVEVCLVDYDVIRYGGEQEIPDSFYEAFDGLREAVANAEGDRDEHGNNRCTSWEES